MKQSILIVIIFLSLVTPSFAGVFDDIEFNILGINPKDFKDRKISHIVEGAVASLVVHELGHIVAGRAVGMNTRFDSSSFVVRADKYDDKSDSDKLLFHSGGFIAQVVVGGLITAMPATRHSDFNLGFNGFTTINSALYTITGGTDDDTSDIHQISEHGGDGKLYGTMSSLTGGIFTYIALDKE
jgi:hypothetical protein